MTHIIATVLLTWVNGDPIYIGAYVLLSGILSSICAFLIHRRQVGELTFHNEEIASPSKFKRSIAAQRA
jgi:hypothetical protein